MSRYSESVVLRAVQANATAGSTDVGKIFDSLERAPWWEEVNEDHKFQEGEPIRAEWSGGESFENKSYSHKTNYPPAPAGTCRLFRDTRWDPPPPPPPLLSADGERWLAHHDREVAVKALRDAADELREIQQNHDIAECAGFVPGEVGRQAVIDRWIGICQEPDAWLDENANRLEAGDFDE